MSKRTADRIFAHLREALQNSQFGGELFLPPERELIKQFGVCRNTVRRALKALEAACYVQSVPRHGYRILAGAANDPERGCPLAVVIKERTGIGNVNSDFHQIMFERFRQAAEDRGISMLGLSANRLSPPEIVTRLHAARAWGVAIDSGNPELVALISQEKLPVALFDFWGCDEALDSVVQDDFSGGMLAVQHLREYAFQHYVWFGQHPGYSLQGRHRYGGAVAELAASGQGLESTTFHATTEQEMERQAFKLLAEAAKPVAIIALWRKCARAVHTAAKQQGLRHGRDYAVVGWCPEEQYAAELQIYGNVPKAAFITWRMEDMAGHCVARLLDRRNNRSLAVNHVVIPVTLRVAP